MTAIVGILNKRASMAESLIAVTNLQRHITSSEELVAQQM